MTPGRLNATAHYMRSHTVFGFRWAEGQRDAHPPRRMTRSSRPGARPGACQRGRSLTGRHSPLRAHSGAQTCRRSAKSHNQGTDEDSVLHISTEIRQQRRRSYLIPRILPILPILPLTFPCRLKKDGFLFSLHSSHMFQAF